MGLLPFGLRRGVGDSFGPLFGWLWEYRDKGKGFKWDLQYGIIGILGIIGFFGRVDGGIWSQATYTVDK